LFYALTLRVFLGIRAILVNGGTYTVATVLRRDFYGVSQSTVFRVTPIGDIHLGAAACDEDRLRSVINRVAQEDNHYWIGMGDYCDWINMKDPRFSVESLADWITRPMMADIAKAQLSRLLDYVKPIAGKCLGLVQGNHERAILKHSERDVYQELACALKETAGFPGEYKLALGIYGWIRMVFHNSSDGSGIRKITINCHHGFTGGKLAGAKALDMQKWLWTHDADIVIFGHCHTAPMQPEAVELLNKSDNIVTTVRKGVYSGTFLKSVTENVSTYSEAKGYFPNPTGIIPEIKIRPWETREKRVRITE
jgi:hypothetical protein